MDLKRLWRTIRLCFSRDRSAYLRKARIFAAFGENSTMSSRKIPLYPELISIGNNVRLAANVSLIPHDMIHAMLNNRIPKIGNGGGYSEFVGCIRIDDNVFVGACSQILGDVHIGSDVIIGAGSLVNRDLEGGYVYAGVPARKVCTFAEFLEKRESRVYYPKGFHRKGDSIPKDFADWMWDDFCRRKGVENTRIHFQENHVR